MNRSARLITVYGPLVLIAVGILFRLGHYLADRSFWLDEAWVALDLNHRSWLEIFTSEDYIKPVPIGFALICKTFRQILGNTEYAFRLFPFLCAAVAVFLYHQLLKRITSSQTALLLALGLFAFSETLIYYSAELKYYSSDVLVTLLLLLLAVILQRRSLDAVQMLLLAVAGSLALWISHVTVFVFPVVAAVLGFRYQSPGERKKLYQFLFIQALWLVNFVIVYLISFTKIESYHGLKHMWDVGFWPWPVWSRESMIWFKSEE